MQTVTVKRHDGEKIKITVDAEGYGDLKRQIARGELPEQTLAAYKGDDDADDVVQNPTATDGQSSDDQKNADGKTAVPPASKPATTGGDNPFDPDKGKSTGK